MSKLHTRERVALLRASSLRLVLLASAAVALSGCGGGGGSPAPAAATPPPRPDTRLDEDLGSFAKTTLGLTGDPAAVRRVEQVVPDEDPLVKLGQMLFFSQTLSANYDVSCGTCHHPDFGMTDGLSIGVGVSPFNPSIIGPGREVDPAGDLDPRADGGPNMHRNSITTLNAALFDRALMFDGRAFVLDEEVVFGGHGQRIQTPESGQRHDGEPLTGLMEFTVKGPIVNDNEMRGFAYTNYATPSEYRDHLMARLRGEVDTEYNSNPAAAENWLELFRAAFEVPNAAPTEVITMLNAQRALAAYVTSQIFVDTPWRDYLAGDDLALTTNAKRGALLFLRPLDEGGLGCAGCHAGDRFTDEAYHNVAFPQLGRGFIRADLTDLGRWFISRNEDDLKAFRTPSLLNIAKTAPYGHAGSFATLEEVIRYHANPQAEIDRYDFTLAHLDQFRALGISYPHSEAETRSILEQPNFASDRLPNRDLSSAEITQLVAFLSSLTDRCVDDPECIGRWAPGDDEDPDGNMVIRDRSASAPAEVDAERPGDYPTRITMNLPALAPRATFADVEMCSNRVGIASNSGENRFVRTDAALGLVGEHAYSSETWFDELQTLEAAMIGGGVTAAYLDDDCWPDLAFTSRTGMQFFRNADGVTYQPMSLLGSDVVTDATGTAVADLDGDYRRELLFGNVRSSTVPVFAKDGVGGYTRIASLPMARPTYGISFAPLDSGQHPYLYFAHWSGGRGTDGTSPALWHNDGQALSPWDWNGGTSAFMVDQRFNFTPKFGDFDNDGLTDLLIASDFKTSMVLRNAGSLDAGPKFENDTNWRVITDENGMGSALLDIDNDGVLEWFVTSVLDHTAAEGNWGVTGNRLYRNVSSAGKLVFEDITTEAGVRDGGWGWGACAADFDNDGFIDLFHVNGFGYIPDDAIDSQVARTMQTYYDKLAAEFMGEPPRLFINQRNGTFRDEAVAWDIAVPSEGRGIACFDYDRDGDIDIAVFDHSSALQFFENQTGSGVGRRFLNVRLVGVAPNTDAIGARVHVEADLGADGGGLQQQTRLAEANSNFNSQNLPDLHFGLGSAETVDTLRVVWPGGGETVCTAVAVNQFIVIDERDGAAACPAGGT